MKYWIATAIAMALVGAALVENDKFSQKDRTISHLTEERNSAEKQRDKIAAQALQLNIENGKQLDRLYLKAQEAMAYQDSVIKKQSGVIEHQRDTIRSQERSMDRAAKALWRCGDALMATVPGVKQ